jgi:uncharacterized protein YlbG (UPF0298 family)
MRKNELDSIFKIVKKIHSTAISDIEKEFNTEQVKIKYTLLVRI